MLRDNLLGLGLLAGAGGFGGLGLAGMHTTVGGTHEGPIAARSTLPSHPLAGGLFTGLTLQLLELGTQGSNFSEEGVHFFEFSVRKGGLRRSTTQGHQSGFSVIVSIIFYGDTKVFHHVWIKFSVDRTFPFCESRFKIFVIVNNSQTTSKKV
jgi:hypothetical protein